MKPQDYNHEITQDCHKRKILCKSVKSGGYVKNKPQEDTRLAQEENKEGKWLYKDLTYNVINAALEVHKELGSGFLEYVYEEALCYELRLREIAYQRQKELDIFYKGFEIDKKYTPDLVIEDKIIVELKSVSGLTKVDEAQLIHYLKAANFKIGLLLNFGSPSLEIKRRIL